MINIPGCPPIPQVMAGTSRNICRSASCPSSITSAGRRPSSARRIHDRCYRRPFYERGQFAETFDDEGARQGWCLYKLGCKGPVTYNACATIKWNGGASFPIQSGHGCLGCSEPDFWDKGGFYRPLSAPLGDVGRRWLQQASRAWRWAPARHGRRAAIWRTGRRARPSLREAKP